MTFLIDKINTFTNFFQTNIAIITPIFMSLVGIFLSICWYCLISRTSKISEHWILSAREMETRLAGTIKMLTRGAELVGEDGRPPQPITVPLDNNKSRTLSLDWFGSKSVLKISKIIVITFICVYLFFIISIILLVIHRNI